MTSLGQLPKLQNVCQSQGWQFCFIGGVALQRWSEPRETVDVDLLYSPHSDKNSNDAELFLQKTRHDRRKAVLLFADAMQDQFLARLNLSITSDDRLNSSLHQARARHDGSQDEQVSPNSSWFFRSHEQPQSKHVLQRALASLLP